MLIDLNKGCVSLALTHTHNTNVKGGFSSTAFPLLQLSEVSTMQLSLRITIGHSHEWVQGTWEVKSQEAHLGGRDLHMGTHIGPFHTNTGFAAGERNVQHPCHQGGWGWQHFMPNLTSVSFINVPKACGHIIKWASRVIASDSHSCV